MNESLSYSYQAIPVVWVTAIISIPQNINHFFCQNVVSDVMNCREMQKPGGLLSLEIFSTTVTSIEDSSVVAGTTVAICGARRTSHSLSNCEILATNKLHNHTIKYVAMQGIYYNLLIQILLDKKMISQLHCHVTHFHLKEREHWKLETKRT